MSTTSVPPSEVYYFRLWHVFLIFLMGFLLDLPFQLDNLYGKEYVVHQTGGVLISGASSGIGKDAAIALAKKNYTVFAGLRKKEDVEALNAANQPNLIPVLLDVTNDKTIKAAYLSITEELKAKDLPFIGLINNAGISQNAPVEFHDTKEIENIFQVNLFGAIKLTQKFLPLLRANKGRIINVSSVLGQYTRPDVSAYSASKHALESYSDALRRELLPLGVSVSVIQPGYVVSPIHDKIIATKKAVSEEAKATYPHLCTSTGEKKGSRHISKASSTKVTSTAILDALSNHRPKTRYPVANVDDIPASLIMVLVGLLPDRTQDTFITHEQPYGI